MPVYLSLILLLFIAACGTVPPHLPVDEPPPLVPEVAKPDSPAPVPIKVAIALGGGAARGFAHVGAIKALEANGIVPDIVVGTSAGAIVGALYAAGIDIAQLEKIAFAIQESQLNDWGLPDRGVIKGEALQTMVNRAVNNLPLEKMVRPFGVVATDLRSGERRVFRTGNTGKAVRAQSAALSLSDRELGRDERVEPHVVALARCAPPAAHAGG